MKMPLLSLEPNKSRDKWGLNIYLYEMESDPDSWFVHVGDRPSVVVPPQQGGYSGTFRSRKQFPTKESLMEYYGEDFREIPGEEVRDHLTQTIKNHLNRKVDQIQSMINQLPDNGTDRSDSIKLRMESRLTDFYYAVNELNSTDL